MQTVNFWSFSKKANSTAQPTATATASFSCDIVDGSGLLAPTIKLHTNFTDPVGYTYAEIPDFGRYYFVKGWRYDKGLWWADLTVDVLATYKTDIGSQTKYIARAASDFDGRIVDNMYPVKAGLSFSLESNNLNPFAVAFASGYFVVGVINGETTAVGAVSYYVFTMAEFRTFSQKLLGDSSYLGTVTDVSTELLKCLFNPFQYVVSCMWVPFTPSMGAAVTSIPIGWWSVTANAHKLSGYTRSSGSVTVSVPKHPDALTRGYYLLQEPYSQYYLEFPPFGAISIPANTLVDCTLLTLYWDCDAISGQGRLAICPSGSIPTNILHAQIGVPVQIAQMAPDVYGAVQSILPTFEGGTLATYANGFMNVLSGITAATMSNICPMQTVGGNGGFMAGYYPIHLTGMFASIPADNSADWGKPLCQNKQINTLSGFVQCADDCISISCMDEERKMIQQYLTAGFFYE